MATKDQVIAQIRFRLSQLSANNAHHEFEHLCRHLTRSRICSNVVPATGPVQAGGDQGRDFETFHTYLKSSPIADSSFIGLASDKPTAFACSLEKSFKKGIIQIDEGKVKRDVKTIVSSGVKVDRIYFFGGENLNVSKRHKLIQWAKETYSVNLEIIDAYAISELLAEPDTFWIANTYLSIPSEFYPRPINEEDWYKDLLAAYKNRTTLQLTFEEFNEIKIAGRHIYKSSYLKQDLPFWLEKLEIFISDHGFPRIKRKAIYEVFVLSYIGLRSVTGRENIVCEYFSSPDDIIDTAELEDAVFLLSFVKRAIESNQLILRKEELNSWQDKLSLNIESKLATAKNPNTICSLLEIQSSFLNLLPKNVWDFQDNFTASIDLLKQLLKHIHLAPLFPLERLSDRLNHYTEIYLKFGIPLDLTELEKVTEDVDALCAERSSNFKVAEKLRDRAAIYLRYNQFIKAIKILHKTKTKWFVNETFKGTILATLLISDSYEKLKMNFAGKYYALIAFHSAMNSDKPELFRYMPQAIYKVAEFDYKNGAWLNFLDIIVPTLILGSRTLKGYIEEHPQVNGIIYNSTIIKYISQRLAPDLQCLIDFHINKLDFLHEYVEALLDEAKKNFDSMSLEKLWQTLNEQLDYRPFNDIGKIRTIRWEALGIIWEISFVNDYLTNSIAEQFVVVLQILLIELAEIDLYLIKGKVKIDLVRIENDSPSCTQKPSNVERLWEIHLPSFNGENEEKLEGFQKNYISFAIKILYELSLLPSEKYKEIFENSYKEDLVSKTMFILPYEVLYKKYISEEKFNESQRNNFVNPFENKMFNLSCVESLKWKEGIAPFYNHEKNIERISNRYNNSIKGIEITLKQLNSLTEFQKTIKYFRNEGWLDWYILMTIMNVAISYKAQKNTRVTTLEDFQEEFERIFDLPEKDNYISLPIEIFNRENLEWQFSVGIISLLSSYGLEYHGGETPDIRAIKELLIKRFHFLTDDVEHEDYFKS